MTDGTIRPVGPGATRSRPRRACRALALAAVLAAGLAGCTGSQPDPGPTTADPVATVATADPVAPGGTVRFAAGSWDPDRVPAGLELAVVVAADDPVAARLAHALQDFADEHGAHAATRTVTPGDAEAALDDATQPHPDVVVAIGAGVVDALDRVSSQNLAQPYLVLGAQLPEPTDNVSAVVWTGATSRGSAAAADGALASSITTERASAAVSAGITAVVTDGTGSILDLVG